MAELPERVRQHEAPHIRHIDVQTLDALLRIEELLQKLIEVTASVPQITVAEQGMGTGRILEDFPDEKALNDAERNKTVETKKPDPKPAPTKGRKGPFRL